MTDKLCPREPTQEMLDCYGYDKPLAAMIWRAMFDAAPAQELLIVGWMVGENPHNAAMYNASQGNDAQNAAIRWNRPITALVLHPAAPVPTPAQEPPPPQPIMYGGTDRGGKMCHCVRCGRISVCSLMNDYYTRPNDPTGPLYCESCIHAVPAQEPPAAPSAERDHENVVWRPENGEYARAEPAADPVCPYCHRGGPARDVNERRAGARQVMKIEVHLKDQALTETFSGQCVRAETGRSGSLHVYVENRRTFFTNDCREVACFGRRQWRYWLLSA